MLLLSVFYAECHNQVYYSECCCAEFRGALHSNIRLGFKRAGGSTLITIKAILIGRNRFIERKPDSFGRVVETTFLQDKMDIKNGINYSAASYVIRLFIILIYCHYMILL
jgi:hypothetical protein